MSRNESQRTIFMMILLCFYLSVASGRRASGDLVEGRVGHFVGLHLRRAFDNLRQSREHAGVDATGVRLCAFFQIPHADTDRVRSARGKERELVLKALLFAKNWEPSSAIWLRPPKSPSPTFRSCSPGKNRHQRPSAPTSTTRWNGF